MTLLEEYVGSKYKGLATDEDVVDGQKKMEIQLNKRLLDHFRVLAASNKDTDEVTWNKCSTLVNFGRHDMSYLSVSHSDIDFCFRWTCSCWMMSSHMEPTQTQQINTGKRPCMRLFFLFFFYQKKNTFIKAEMLLYNKTKTYMSKMALQPIMSVNGHWNEILKLTDVFSSFWQLLCIRTRGATCSS